MALYKVRSGEGLFDVAAKLYRGDTAGGIQDLLSLNPDINLNASDLFGLDLTYTETLTRAKEKFPAITIIAPDLIYTTREKQSVYDLSVQLYGDLSQIRKLLVLFPNLDNLITVGSGVEVEEQIDPVALYFSDRNLKVSTDISEAGVIEVDNILLESGDDVLLESGDLILIE